MKAYLIDAKARQITEIEYLDYTGMTKYLPGGLCIGATFENGDVLFVDDKGLLHKAEMAFRIRRRRDGQPMMSNGILTGADTVDDTLPPTMTIEELQAEIEWLTVDEALDWFRGRQSGAAMTITSMPKGATEPQTEVLSQWGEFLQYLEGKP